MSRRNGERSEANDSTVNTSGPADLPLCKTMIALFISVDCSYSKSQYPGESAWKKPTRKNVPSTRIYRRSARTEDGRPSMNP